ncbi:hypothetical protein DXG01_008075 [Tephrocybe rancida]|nr:hypothetical protein DXG01_008075 [Tephrocybe rancida]
MTQLLPLEVNSTTGEPFLRVSHPHNHDIIITPPRLHDVDAVVAALNDPRVYRWMTGPPLPYQPEHGLSWLSEQMEEAEQFLRHLEEPVGASEILKPALGCPVRIIREVKEDGTDIYLGFLGIYRSERKEILDVGKRAAVLADDARKKAGDPTILWDIADYVVPDRHGQGIMSAAISTLIQSWAIPRLNAHKMQASVLEGNVASIKVLEKVGFKLRGTLCDYEDVRGVSMGTQWLEWTRE